MLKLFSVLVPHASLSLSLGGSTQERSLHVPMQVWLRVVKSLRLEAGQSYILGISGNGRH